MKNQAKPEEREAIEQASKELDAALQKYFKTIKPVKFVTIAYDPNDETEARILATVSPLDVSVVISKALVAFLTIQGEAFKEAITSGKNSDNIPPVDMLKNKRVN